MSHQNSPLCVIAKDVKLGRNVRLHAFVNLYGCTVGDDVRIGTFVEIQKGAQIGNNCKIQSHSFICEGVTLEDEVFVGHNVTFINDRFPRATNDEGLPKNDNEWMCERTLVNEARRLAPASRFSAGLPSVNVRSLEPAALLPRMSPPARLSPEIPREFFVA
jgi:carbonic anhydrase/acetyltransferase-like protein (isoleucine patch superfamily)